MIKHLAGIPFIAVSAIFLSASLQAQVTSTWEGGASGAFGASGNWSNGVPESTDTARFVDAGVVEVTFSTDHHIGLLAYLGVDDPGPPVVSPQLTFVLGSHTLTNSDSMRVNNSTSSGTMTFVQDGGTIVVTSTFGVAWGNVSGVIPAATSRSVVSVENGGILDIGNQMAVGYTSDATGELHITGGSKAEVASTAWVGRNGVGLLSIRGEDSSFVHTSTGSNNHFSIGHSSGGDGTLEILDGAVLTTSRVMNLAQHSASTGTLLVSGSGSELNSSGNLYVGGYINHQTNPPTAGGTALATFEDGASATFSLIRTLAANPGSGVIGTLEFNQSGGVSVGDAVFDAGSVVRFTLHVNGQSADLVVADELLVSGSILEAFLAPSFEPIIGNSFALISYGTLLSGTFANEDGLVVIDDRVFAIDYNLGGADIIGLTLIPEPSAAALFGGIAVVLCVLIRRRALARRI